MEAAIKNGGTAMRAAERWEPLGEDPQFERLETPRDERLREIYAYWRGKCGADGLLPGRSSICPLELRRLLPHVHLVAVEPGGLARHAIYRIRLIGTAQTEFYGGDPTGKTLESAFGPEHAGPFRRTFDWIRRHREPVAYRARVFWRDQHEWLGFEGVQMPLAGNGMDVDMIFGGAAFYPMRHFA